MKVAWERAQREDAAGSTLNLLFRHALEAGKRARSETGIGQGTASVSYAAVALAAQHLGSLEGRRVIVLGAGDMGTSMAESLTASGVAELVIANRTHGRATELARSVGGRAIRFADLPAELVDADVGLTSTGATSVLLSRADVEAAMAERAGRPLVLVDIAVPRDIDPSVAEVPGVTVFDMDDLAAFADRGLAERRREVDAVRAILDEELERFRSATSAREIAPVIVALREAAEATRAAELDRVRTRLGSLDEGQLAAVEQLTQGLVAKLLHQPTMALRDAAGSAKGERLVQALRDLYDLD